MRRYGGDLPVGEMFGRAFTEQRLLDAWDKVRSAAMADGAGGPEVDRFEAAAARHVSELAQALADGTYEPDPVVRVEIAKSSGGVRRLAVPSLRDRIVERALLAELDVVVDPLLLPWSFAFRHGLGVRDAVASWRRLGMRARAGWRGATSTTALSTFRVGR